LVARPLRIDAPGVIFHLIARGNARGFVFLDDQDRRVFLELLARVVERFGWVVYAYCLMSNHYHLVVMTPRGGLSRGMGQVNGGYARYFNRCYGRCGHVFQARFRSILVESDSYLKGVCRYVVLNPVRAGLCRHPREWLWSSYRATAGIDRAPGFLAVEELLGMFASSRAAAEAAYRRFVDEGRGEALEQQVVGERLGGEAFLRQRLGDEFDPEIPRVQIEPLPPPLEQLFANGDPAAILSAYRRHGYTLKQIADHLGCHYSTISRKLRREETLVRNSTLQAGPDA
jgi:REP-associated tyrosine transposase